MFKNVRQLAIFGMYNSDWQLSKGNKKGKLHLSLHTISCSRCMLLNCIVMHNCIVNRTACVVQLRRNQTFTRCLVSLRSYRLINRAIISLHELSSLSQPHDVLTHVVEFVSYQWCPLISNALSLVTSFECNEALASAAFEI